MLTAFISILLVVSTRGYGWPEKLNRDGFGEEVEIKPILDSRKKWNSANGFSDETKPVLRSELPDKSWILASYADGTPIPGLAESRNRHNRALIINGKDATPDAQPYMVSIQVLYNGKSFHICGGSLWSSTKVVTAAHCLGYWDTLDYQVALGYYQLSLGTGNANSQLIPVAKAEGHPDYQEGNGFPNDIAVLTLKSAATTNAHVKTGMLATFLPDHYVGQKATMTGWGLTVGEVAKSQADILQFAEFEVITRAECEKAWPDMIRDEHVCLVGNPEQGCQGDSGGPLMNAGLQMGVVSWGPQNCDPKWPSIYASPGYFKTWLTEMYTS